MGKQPMKTPHGSNESASESSPANGRTVCISTAVFAVCLALYLAELHGFRVFDESARRTGSGEPVIPSPLEILTLLGMISVGVSSGLVALFSSGIWLTGQLRHIRMTSASRHSETESLTEETHARTTVA